MCKTMNNQIRRSFLYLKIYLFFSLATLGFYNLSAYSITQYRCAGLIQYRPCNDDRAIPALLSQREKNANAQNINERIDRAQMKSDFDYPSIFSVTYQYNKQLGVGIWRGYVLGEGPVELNLTLYSPDAPSESRYMGRVVLRGKSSPFEFHSAPPRSSKWNWHISAKNAV